MTLLVDHNNLFSDFRDGHLKDINKVIENWIVGIVDIKSLNRDNTLNLRIYGGWDEDGHETQERIEAALFYSTNLNYYFWIDDKYFRIKLAFANTLLMVPTVKIRDTFKRRSYGNIKIRPSRLRICSCQGCEAKNMIKWVRSGKACLKPGCSNSFSDFFETAEQKQVDTHITADAIYQILLEHEQYIGLISSDLDFSPIAIIAANQKYTQFAIIRRRGRPFYWENTTGHSNVAILEY